MICFEDVGAFETQDPAWTTVHAFSTGQTVAILNWNSQPGMPTNVYIDGTVIGANTALYTTGSIGYDVSLYQGCPAGGFLFK